MAQPTIKDLIRGCEVLEIDRQGDTILTTKTGFLDLPGELRNIVYGLVAETVLATTSPTSTDAPRICEYRSSYGRLLDFSDAPHPLTQVCRLVRSEFSSFLGSDKYPENSRHACVVDYNFRTLPEHLRLHPPLRTPCHLEIQLQFTQRGADNWAGPEEWLRECRVDHISSAPTDALHTIHGCAYKISLIAQPGSFHNFRHGASQPFRDAVEKLLDSKRFPPYSKADMLF
jgi:hypothetical protein